MNKISSLNNVGALNVGIEASGYLGSGELQHSLPQRFQLPPAGQAVATHLPRLYQLRLSEQHLLGLATLKLSQLELLRPEKYRQQFEDTLHNLKNLTCQYHSPSIISATTTLEASQLEQNHLTMALYLLIEV